jgi:UDP-N-acetylmuramate dehydrogenase
VATDIPVLVVGRGSNLLVADTGFPGLALVLGEGLSGVDIEGTEVRAGGGASLPVVARRSAAAGLHGLEWAVGVPGSVGGAVRMNAGGHGSDMASCLVSARVYEVARPPGAGPGHVLPPGAGPGQAGPENPECEIPAADLALSYRRSSIGPGQVVVEARFALSQGDRDVAERRIADIVRWRREHQPGGPNAGSVFTNPPGDAAGRLIEEAGLRGARRGSACVSPKHANFIQVDEGGCATDVLALMDEVARVVQERTGVRLAAEVRLVGFDDYDPQGEV